MNLADPSGIGGDATRGGRFPFPYFTIENAENAGDAGSAENIDAGTKSGSTRCAAIHYSWMKSRVDTFTIPLIHSPGDNEWTDCHHTNTGGYHPLGRLVLVRETYFSNSGTTSGAGRHAGCLSGRSRRAGERSLDVGRRAVHHPPRDGQK